MSATAAESTAQHRWPALDGLRGLAILLVLLSHLGAAAPHAFWQVTQGGIVGVDVFFVLSGFLITSLLVGEWDRGGSINLPRFYMRRALRLLPALLVLIVVVAIGAVTVIPEVWRQPTLSGIPYALFYASDLRWVIPGALPSHPGFLDPMWSLSLEEQFYLVWPSLLVLILTFLPGARRSRAMQIAVAGAILIELHRALLFVHGGSMWARLYVSPDTHTDGLLIGCALAFVIQRRSLSPRILRAAGMLGLAVILVFTIFLGPVSPVQPAVYFQYNGFGLIALASAFLIWSLIAGAAPRFLQTTMEASPMRFLGRISYALYLWNVPVLWTLELKGMPWIPAVLIRTAAAVGAATASYYLVERPFLRIKARRWASVPAMASAAATAGVPTRRAGAAGGRPRPTAAPVPGRQPRR